MLTLEDFVEPEPAIVGYVWSQQQAIKDHAEMMEKYFPAWLDCDACKGAGEEPGYTMQGDVDMFPCDYCKGWGRVRKRDAKGRFLSGV